MFTLTPTGRDALTIQLDTGASFTLDASFIMEIMAATDDGASNFDMEQIEETIAEDAAAQDTQLTVEQAEEIQSAVVLFLVEGRLPEAKLKTWCVVVRDFDEEVCNVAGPFPTEEAAQAWVTEGEEQLLRDVECTRQEFDSTDPETGALLSDGGYFLFQIVELMPAL